ncbi:MAG: glycosyltransferase [Elusimicrobia bacterium]|nr:glycosyltransferase [Elusimicrobiota bacterium]
MKRILVIPHHPASQKIKIRLIEIAKYLANGNEVYLLIWSGMGGERTLKNRVITSLEDLFKKTKIYRENDLNIVEIPSLHRPLWLLRSFNSFFLNRVIRKLNFDIVINGSYYQFPIRIKNRKFRYIYDIADLPASAKKGTMGHFIEEKVRKEIHVADAVTVISNEMVEYMKEQYGIKAHFVPNGADLERMRSVSDKETADIRKKYGLEGKWVIGYAGYMGGWVNVELVVESFRNIKTMIPEAVLLWIGLSPNFEELKRKYEAADIIFTGGILGNIESYFNVFDIGLMCHRVSPMQDKAFHLKIIEYTAAHKIIVSNKLKETRRLNFPNIIFTDENAKGWTEALLKAKGMRWDPLWNRMVEPYDWKNIVNKFVKIAGDIEI